MKKNKNPLFLPKYEEWMKTGRMAEWGLCDSLTDKAHQPFLDIISPTRGELDELVKENCASIYWGAGIPREGSMLYQFTPLRQTLVLLMAALNNEL